MNGSETMTIYLDEQNLPPLSSSTLAHSLESKGFLPAIEIRDFPIRDNKVTLYVRRRKWIALEKCPITARSLERYYHIDGNQFER